MRTQMKKLILISALLFSFNGWTNEQGLMRCEIKSMGLETIEDGKPKSYTHYEDSEKVGDTLHFTYLINDIKALVMSLKDPREENPIIWGAWGFPDLERNYLSSFNYESDWEEGTFGKNFIMIDTFGTEVRLYRYYKSDWQGIFSRRLLEPNGIYYFTLDCRHSKDLIDEVYETISEFHDQKFPKEN